MATQTPKSSHNNNNTNGVNGTRSNVVSPNPELHQRGVIIQQPNTVRDLPIGLSSEIRQQHADALNQLLADTITLYSMYKKHHWQVSGHTFYQLHLLFDKHANEQLELVDLIAERVQSLGGVAIGMPHDVAERTTIERPPAGVETVPVLIDRLLEAHEIIIKEARVIAKLADQNDDLTTNDLLASEVLPTNELQVWFVAEHVVATPVVNANGQVNN